MRVYIDQRKSSSKRRFLELDQLLADCNADGQISVPGSK